MAKLNYHTIDPLIIDPDGIQTNAFLPTAGTPYKRGDLLALSAAGVLTHVTDGTGFSVINMENITAEQSTKHAADGVGIPVYTHVHANLDAVMVNGVVLTAEQKTAARAHAVLETSLTIRSPANTKGA